MVLYQPSPNEITAAVAALTERHPHLTKRAAKAAAILADIDTNFDCDDTDHWRIRSQSDNATWHTVTDSTCDCTDYQINVGKTRSGTYFCKHRLAYHGYRHLLIRALERRVVGNFKFLSERQIGQHTPGSILLLTDEKRFRCIAYSPFHRFPRHLCYLRLDKLDRPVPHRLSDFVALAEWLPTAPAFSITMPEPRMEDFTPDRLPTWPHEDFQHWIATGDTPSMRLAYS